MSEKTKNDLSRCPWCGDEPIYVAYHDHEWGVPLRDDRQLFELLVLEGAQAGLSWLTILRKRAAYRRAFDQFAVERVATFGEERMATLLADSGIVRNRRKIEAAIGNARAFLTVQQEHGSFARYLWSFIDGQPIHNSWRTMAEIPARTPLSEQISKDLRRRGFRFVGPTIVYAYLQSAGLVNDHLVDCFRYEQVAALAEQC